MPYNGPGDTKLPENVKKMPEKMRMTWVNVFNSAHDKCQKENGDDCEGAAMAQANGAVKSHRDTFLKEAGQPEQLPLDTKMYDEYSNVPPTAPVDLRLATSFADLEAMEMAEEETRMVRKKVDQFSALAENIMYNPEVSDKTGAIAGLVSEFAQKVGNKMRNGSGDKERWQPLTDKAVEAIDNLTGKSEPEPEPETKAAPPKRNFYYLKQGDRLRWVATYSNNYRDQDNPPEIISKASHQRFVAKAQAGEAPMPELWLWHIPGTRWGHADYVAWDDRGFATATGLVDKGKEWIAEALPPDVLVSHGMPNESIKRDSQDKSIIIEHETREISPLPAGAAANKLTGFQILDEVKEMAFSEQDKQKLAALGVDPEQLETANAGKAAAAQAERLESKAAKEETAVEVEQPDTVEDTPAEQPAPEYVTTAQWETLQTDLRELTETIAASQKGLADAIKGIGATVEELKRNDDEKVKEAIANTPAASLSGYFKSAIGSEEARIDGRTSLAKAGPVETPPNQPQQAGIPFLNNIIAGQQRRQ